MFIRAGVFCAIGLLPAAVGAAEPPLSQPAVALGQSGAPADLPEFYAPDPALAGYVREALETSPGIQESLANYRASLERVHVATALPDPMVTFTQALRTVETRVGPQLDTVVLSQAFPWFGKLDLRGKVAVQEAAATYQMYRMRQRDVIAQVKKAYYNLAYVESALGIAREEHALLDHYEGLAQARYASGQGLQHAAIKFQTEITKVVSRVNVLRQQRETLAARVNTLMNRAPERPLPAAAASALPPDVSLDLPRLYATGDAERPEITAADALVGRGEWGVKLARKNFWPDLTVGAGVVNVGHRTDAAGVLQPPPDNGKNAVTLTVGVNLPIRRNKYRADLQRASDELSAAQLHRADAHNEMAFAVREQVVRLQTLRKQLSLVGDVLLPQTDEALRSTESAYETGQVGVLDLLDSERGRLDVRLIHARDIADYLVALADLERAIGAPFPAAQRVP